jgi:hypothetical protein
MHVIMRFASEQQTRVCAMRQVINSINIPRLKRSNLQISRLITTRARFPRDLHYQFPAIDFMQSWR